MKKCGKVKHIKKKQKKEACASDLWWGKDHFV